MIKLLRRLRKEFLLFGRSNNPSSPVPGYLLYALGEILLVVIGILIALRINNWNEERKSNVQEQLLLIQLREEYESNLSQLDDKIEIRNWIISSSKKLLDHIDGRAKLNQDSLILYLSQSSFIPTFDPVTNQLIASGNLTLLRDERLKKALSKWTTDVVQVKEEEDRWSDFNNLVREPFLVKNNLTRNIASHRWKSDQQREVFIDKTSDFKLNLSLSKRNIDYNALLMLPEFESILANGINRNALGNVQSYALRKQIEYILKLINENLLLDQSEN